MNPIAETPPNVIAKPQTGFAEIRTDVLTGNRSLFAKKSYQKDEVISPFYWSSVHTTPNYLTIQTGDNEHIELLPTYLECVNHSCDPNCFFDTTHRQLVSLKPIQSGEELTFFYPSSEWDMDQSFVCHCGSEQCIHLIKGAKYLSPEQLRQYRFTDFINQKLSVMGQ